MIEVRELISNENVELVYYLIGALGIFAGFRTLMVLSAKLFDLFAASLLLKYNHRLNCNRTFLSLQRLGGQVFTGKLLKIGWTKVYLVSTDDGELIEFSTVEFHQAVKKYKLTKPSDVGSFASLAPGDFEL